MKLVLGGFITFILVLILAGVIYQAVATRIDLKKYPPPGKLVDVGGYKLHINCMGEGAPTVIMDYGLGGLSPTWSLVQPEVAKFTTVCIYDRAGYAWSDSSPKPRTSKQMVEELNTLLTNAGVKEPYVLVGHSLGGLNVRLFASKYPDKVAGLVLVDAIPPDVYTRLSPKFQDYMAETGRMFRNLFIISRLGLLRVAVQFKGTEAVPDFVRKLPVDIQPIIVAKFLPKTFKTAIAENLLMESSAEQVSSTILSNNVPLVVLSHGVNMFGNSSVQEAFLAFETWTKLQAETADFSSHRLIIAENSGHNIHIDEPQLVIDAIQEVIKLHTSK